MPEKFTGRLRSHYTNIAVVAFNTMLGLLALNLIIYAGFKLSDFLGPDTSSVEDKYGLASLAPVYPEWEPFEVAELLRETWALNRSFRPYVHFREDPAAGKYVNVHPAGFRYSTNQAEWPPPPHAKSVFVLGGSTTFGYGVPDESTVPSRLQDAFRSRSNDSTAVNIYNFGAGSYQSTQEKIWFKELLLHGHRPDLVIFINGLNEFAFPHEPQDSSLIANYLSSHRRMRLRIAGGLLADVPMIKLALTLRSAMYEYTRKNRGTDAKRCDAGESDDDFLDSIIDRYLANIAQIKAVAETHSVRTAFVWQPIPYHEYDTAYHPFFDPCGVNLFASPGYERFRARIERDGQPESIIWAADIQGDIRAPLYVDSVHYTEAFSNTFATWIFDNLDHGQDAFVFVATGQK